MVYKTTHYIFVTPLRDEARENDGEKLVRQGSILASPMKSPWNRKRGHTRHIPSLNRIGIKLGKVDMDHNQA